MSKKKTISAVVAAAGGLIANENIQKALFGEYSDGTARSLPDCLEGEILSPNDRKKMLYGKKYKKKMKARQKNKNKKTKRRAKKIHFE